MENCTDSMSTVFQVRGNANSLGVITLRDGKIHLKGFAGLLNHRVRIEIQNDAVVITLDHSGTDRQGVDFNETMLSRKVLIDFFDETESLDCLFVRTGNMWRQVKNITVTSSKD